jgi:Ala-tRNA(Pro) deacylase
MPIGYAVSDIKEESMPAKKLTEFLNANEVKYATIVHSPAYTAEEVAQSTHIKGEHLAKSVILNADNRLLMMVLSASHRVDLDALKPVIGAVKLELSSEKEFKDLFPTCELGALPPFGNLYGMDVYLADCFVEDDLLTFCAGSRSELIQMEYKDFQRLVEPKMISAGFVHLGDTPPRMKEHKGIYRI